MATSGGDEERSGLGKFVKSQAKYGTTTKQTHNNETFIKHTVEKGETLQGIALKHGVTEGIVMSIIGTLSASVDVAQREREKARLEKLYKESDKKLDTLVDDNYQDLTSIIQAFSKISAKISSSQESIRAIKDNLQSCKNLMHCKRDELRKLWIDGIEHKTIVSLLDQIEQVKDAADVLQGHIDKKQFLHASDLLLKSVSLVDGDLTDVEALGETKAELHARKEELYEMLVDELHKQIYVKSTTSIMKSFQRQGSLRHSQRGDKMYLKVASQQAEAEAAAEEALRLLQEVRLEDVTAPQTVVEDLNVDPERDPVQYIAVLVEALATLRRMPEAIDALRTRIKPGLLMIVQRASQQVADTYYLEGEDMRLLDQPQYLQDLLDLVFKQLRIVARVHQIILANMQRIKTTLATLGDFCLYDTAEVWTKIQEVLSHVLREYLDARNTAAISSSTPGMYTDTTTDISAFFSKKKIQRSKKNPLFRFDSSSHAISLSSYLREQRQETFGLEDAVGVTAADRTMDLGHMQLVCKPCPENITVVYKPLQKFMKEIEAAIRGPAENLTLQAFVNKFIREVYLDQVMDKINSNIAIATKDYNQQMFTVDLRVQRELGVAKPLLKSTVLVYQSVEELCELMYVLPDYADQFLSMIIKILKNYHEVCNNTYESIVSHETDKRTISATWAKDDDINRLLRSLPNWSSLKDAHMEGPKMSEEDLRAMNAKESLILTSNLASSDVLIPHQELILESLLLRALGNLCESMEWFSQRITDLTTNLSSGSQQLAFSIDSTNLEDLPLISVSESTLMILRNLSQAYQHLSEKCLIVLHLEVRVHCFYFLMPLAKQHNYFCALDDMDPDINVTKLIKTLGMTEDVLHHSLQNPKFRYVFQGLGHLVSSIFINSTQYFTRINENGIKKMCRNIFALQQCLTGITQGHENDLDRTRQYYELLYLAAGEVIQHIVEHGPMFSEQEYTNLLALSHRSERGAKEGALQERLGKLNDILVKYDSLKLN